MNSPIEVSLPCPDALQSHVSTLLSFQINQMLPGACALAKSLPGLQLLKLAGCHKISDDTLELVSMLLHHLGTGDITAQVGHLTKLKTLDLSGTRVSG